jgi:hypothetical protein
MKVLAWILAVFYAVNGAVMIADPQWWYGATPGVSGTGPFNPHFVVDVGIAFLGSGLLIGWGASGAGWRLVLAGAAFPVGHALFHIVGFLDGHVHGPVWVEALGVVLPAGLAVWAAWTMRKQENQT